MDYGPFVKVRKGLCQVYKGMSKALCQLESPFEWHLAKALCHPFAERRGLCQCPFETFQKGLAKSLCEPFDKFFKGPLTNPLKLFKGIGKGL